ncbi:hypothetical protein QLX67_00595 [Balneolaceae bacterium ANBcel3]|nr:hypothetical protein [Balneolaceae bacterium ANBcel3]
MSGQKADLKLRLLELSEKIVDLSDRLSEAESLGETGKSYRLTGDLKEVGSQVEDLLTQARDDDRTFALFMLGSVYAMTGYIARAEEKYRQALSSWPDHVGLLNELFDVLVLQEKYAEAENILESIIQFGGETPLVLRNKAGLFAKMGKEEEAAQTLAYSRSLFPEDTQTLEVLENRHVCHCGKNKREGNSNK